MLDRGNALGQYITHYRQTYFLPDYSGYNWKPMPGSEEKIYKRIAPLVQQLRAEDYLELPQLVENIIEVELPPKVMAAYLDFEEELITWIKDKKITAKTAAVKSGRCRQIASGGIYLEPELKITGYQIPQDAREWLNIHEVKLDALEDLISELHGSPLLVGYEFEHDLDRLKRRFGKEVPYIGGGVSVKRGKQLEEAWNRGDLPVLFGQPQSMAMGLNLQDGGGYHICWHTLT